MSHNVSATTFKSRFKTWLKRGTITIVILILLLAVIIACAIPYSQQQTVDLFIADNNQKSLLIINAQIIDVEKGTLSSSNAIAITDNKILGIGDKSDFQQSDYQVIDAKQQYLSPGLVDAHVHVFDPQDLGLYLSHGITSVRNMAGLPAHLRWKDLQAKGKLTGARLITSSPALNSGDDIGPFHIKIDSAKQAKALVQQYKQQGYDLIKVYNGLSQTVIDSILEEANQQNMPVAGHPSIHSNFEQTLSSTIDSLEHAEELFQVAMKYKYNDDLAEKLTKEIAASQKTIVPTLVAYQNIYKASQQHLEFKDSINCDYLTPFAAFVGDKQLGDYWHSHSNNNHENSWESKKMKVLSRITQKLFNHGASIAIGTDTGPALTMPGLSYHQELQTIKDLGVSNQQILLSATKTSARLLNNPLIKGEIEVGQLADFVLTQNNPLEDLSTLKEPVAVVSNGHYLNESALIALRTQGKEHHSFYTVLGWLLEGKFLN